MLDSNQTKLAPLAKCHAAAMLSWMQDPEVAENVGLRSQPSLQKTLDWIERVNDDSSVHALAIEHDGSHVGNVVLDRIDQYLGTARLSIYIGEAKFRGMKIGQRALALVSNYARETLGLHKIWLTVHEFNSRAIAAYVAAGFEIEGVLRDEFILREKRCNALTMGKLLAQSDQKKRLPNRTGVETFQITNTIDLHTNMSISENTFKPLVPHAFGESIAEFAPVNTSITKKRASFCSHRIFLGADTSTKFSRPTCSCSTMTFSTTSMAGEIET